VFRDLEVGCERGAIGTRRHFRQGASVGWRFEGCDASSHHCFGNNSSLNIEAFLYTDLTEKKMFAALIDD
jgi:hypothetical protein